MLSRRGIGSLRCSRSDRRRRVGRWALWRRAGAALAAVLVAAAVSLPARASKPTYQELESKAAAAQGAKRAELLSQLALLDYANARQSYEAGRSQEGAQRLTTLEQHGEQAMALLEVEAARGKKKGMKKVEIAFRQVVFGLADLGHEANYRDLPAIEAAQKRFSARRQQLLAWLFAGKKRASGGAMTWHG